MWMTLAKTKYRKKPVLFQGNIFSNQMSRRAKLQSGYRCYHVDLMDTKKLSRKDILFSLASIQNIYSMQKCILKYTDFKGKKTCCLTSELTCLIEGKEVNRERKKKILM